MNPAYFWWGVGLVYLGITLLAIDAYYEPWIRNQGLLVKAVISLIFVAIYTAFTFTFVWVNASLNVSAFIDSNEYRTGSVIAGIPWSSRYSQLHVMLANPTSIDYEAVDVLLRPDEPIAGIGQKSELLNVLFIINTTMTAWAGIVDLSSGRRQGVELMTLAFDGGYRVRCEKLPKNSQLDIVVAIGRPTGKKGVAFDFRDGSHYWARSDIDGTKSLDDYFEPQRITKSVQVDGEYTAAQRTRNVRMQLAMSDILGQFGLPNKN